MIIGTGIDLVEIKRIERIYRRFGDTFLKRIYTSKERQYCLLRSFPAPSLAARFAAKEASVKALGSGFVGITMQEIGVEVDEQGAPFLVLTGGALKKMRERKIHQLYLSLSHSREYAIASVIATGKEVYDGDCYRNPDEENRQKGY